jgi:hypothetical protein
LQQPRDPDERGRDKQHAVCSLLEGA